MASTTRSGAFGKREGKANEGVIGLSGVFDFASNLASSIFGAVTSGITTETAGDVSLYKQQTDDLKTKRTQNIVIAIVAAAVAAAAAWLLLRRK